MAGGDITLAIKLGKVLSLPGYHVDPIQLLPGWPRTRPRERDRALNVIAGQSRWIIDGIASDEVAERGLNGATTIRFIGVPPVASLLAGGGTADVKSSFATVRDTASIRSVYEFRNQATGTSVCTRA